MGKWACDRCLYATGYEEDLYEHMKDRHGLVPKNGGKIEVIVDKSLGPNEWRLVDKNRRKGD